MSKCWKRVLAMVLCLTIVMSIQNIETVFGIVPNAIGLITSEIKQQIKEYTQEINETSIAENLAEETSDVPETEVLEEVEKNEEALPLYNSNKTTVAAQQAINYDSYDNINIGVYNHKDWQSLVAITHKTNLEGVTVIISNDGDKSTDKQTWNLTLADLTYSENNVKYYGLGSEEYPFAGNLISQFTITIKPKVALFNYLSSKATIGSSSYTITLNYANSNENVNAGLAEHLVLESDSYSYSYTKLNITGYIGKSNGTSEVAGGLFTYVQKKDDTVTDAKFLVNSKMASLATINRVYGKIAGGIVGQVQEGVTVEMSACPILPIKVQSSGTCAGGVVGKLQANTVFQTSSTQRVIELKHGTTNGSGSPRTTGTGYVGGLIGWVQDAEVNVSHIKKEDSVSGTMFVGGLIGFAESTSADAPVVVTVSDFILASFHVAQTTNSTTASYCVGGVVGKYQTTENDTDSKLEITRITSAGAARELTNTTSNFPRIESPNVANKEQFFFNGGIVGGIYGNNVKIHEIEFTSDSYKINQVTNINGENSIFSANTKTVGSIAGSIVGKNIEVDNIVLGLEKNYTGANDYYYNNGLSGKVVGGLVGKIGYFDNNNVTGTKIKVTNIKVNSYAIWSSATVSGGLFGDVGKGSVISLGGEINLVGLTKSSSTATTYTDLLGDVASKGFVAGKITEALVYFETDAVVTRPITVDEEGDIYFASTATGDINTKSSAYRLYTISDVGNYGSIYQNIEGEDGTPVIVIDNPIGTEVTGSLTTTTYTDGETYYVIDSLADALRLSIAGHTYDLEGDQKPRFAGNCFGGKAIAEIFQSKFLLQCDLNLKDAGIHGFARNDNGGLKYGFSGTMRGDTRDDGNKYTITMYYLTRQNYGGLFPQLTSGVIFDNLTFIGHLGYQRSLVSGEGAVGTLAANCTGDITITNVDIKTKIKGYYVNSAWDNSTMYSYGGVVGTVNLSGGTILVDKCNISPEIKKIHTHYFVGGLFGKVTTPATGNVITVTNSTIATQYIADTYFCNSSTGHAHHARGAGLIGFIGHSYTNVGSTSGGNAIPGSVTDTTYTTMTIDNCEIKDAAIDLTNANATNIRMVGGFLGYGWCNVDAAISNIKVTGDSKIYSRGSVGGLVSFISGRCVVNNIEIDSLEMKSVYGTNVHYSSFLFGNGRYAYITLDQTSYRINTDGSVSATGYTNFDEIVGINLAVTDSNNANANTTVNVDYNDNGVLNIINSEFKSFKTSDYGADESYGSYKNQIRTNVNKCTRYYYNLFVGDAADWTIGGTNVEATIDTPKKFMTWHVSNYANSNIRRFFKGYYSVATNYIGIHTINITEDLDMNGYSLYPTKISNKTINGNGHEIKLYGEEISDLEKALYDGGAHEVNRNNEYLSTTTQHYMMHAALFYNMSGGSINGLTLSGTAAYNDVYSGALVAGSVTGAVTIQDIVIDNLKIGHYGAAGKSVQCGLLISRIGTTGGTAPNNAGAVNVAAYVTIDNVETRNYTTSTAPVAAALIGSVGSPTATDVQIYFTNMRIGDEASDNIFRYASLIYYYNYTSDIEANNCYSLYTFNYADTVKEETDATTGITTTTINHNVTYGNELIDGANYNDYLLDSIETSFGADAENPLADAITNANHYLPYVYDTKNTYVNPRNGNITDGCGTYEDPYIINNAKQLLTLYCYLTGKTSYYTMLEGVGESVWKINRIGGNGDGYECIVKADDTGATIHETVAFALDTDGKIIETFPTIDDLCTAYYQITANIDMESTTDLNDVILVQEFNGIGTQEHPFAGVIAGTELTADTYPTITLPRLASSSTSQLYYGLLQYMKGAVVKDLNITTPVTTEGVQDDTVLISVTESAGGIAAVVLGGDNIIDNVTTAVKLQAYNASTYDTNSVTLGGYIGVLKNGSVILRNISGKAVVQDCVLQHYDTKNKVTYAYKYRDTVVDADITKLVSSNYVGLLVGKVEDGYLLYEHNATENAFADADKKVLSKTDLMVSSNTTLALANGFDIINGYALDQAAASGKIDVIADTDGNLTVNLKNGEALEIIALALNSDALSISSNPAADRITSTNIFGYDYTAKCRKMQYSGLGTKGDDRNLAQMYDDGKNPDNSNLYLYPYLLYKYVKFENTVGTDEANYSAYISNAIEKNAAATTSEEVYASKFNKVEDFVKDYTTTYTLDKNVTSVFDVSGFGISFRGLGALYSVGKSDFRANFNGNGKSVKVSMDRSFEPLENLPTGMFNALTYDTRIGATVTNRTEIVDSTDATPLVIENFTIVDSVFKNTTGTGSFTGAVAGKVEGVWNFNNIAVAITEDYSTKTEEAKPVIAGNRYIGGLIGSISATKWHVSTYNDAYHTSSNIINITNCGVTGLAGSVLKITAGASANAAGGLVGGVGRYFAAANGNNEFYFGTVNIVDCYVTNTDILLSTSGNAGGFVGEAGYRNSNLSYSMVGVLTVTNAETFTGNNIDTVTIKNTVSNSTIADSSMGGVIGKVQMLNQANKTSDYAVVTVSGYSSDKKFSVNALTLIPSENKEGLTYAYTTANGIGGIIGLDRTRTTELLNISVKDSVIGTKNTSNLSTGGIVGYYCVVQGGNINSIVLNTIENVEVLSSQILSKAGMVGGYIGYAMSENNIIKNGEVSDCTLVSKEQVIGGLIGMLNPNIAGNTTKITNQQVTKTKIQTLDTSTDGANTKAAGGIVGHAYTKSSTIEVGNIYVGQGCNIRGSKGGGGIFGILGAAVTLTVSNWLGVGAKYDDTTTTWTEDSEYNNISGRIAGGITGCDDSTSARSIAFTLYVAKNRIYSYDRMKNAAGRCGSGGLVGYKYGGSGQVIYDDVRIKNNVIITSGRCGDANNCYGTGNNNFMPAVGGFYGRLEVNGGNATFCSSIVLENNSIGFYDISTLEENDAKYEQYKNLTIYSDDVKLFYYNITDKKLEAVNWKNVAINESNVGQYSIGIGTYIGYYIQARQMNFLRSDVSFDENIGSIPVIDVGNIQYATTTAQYGTSYPYAYRTYCHFIDLQETTATNSIIDSAITGEAGEEENFFEHIGTVIQEYKDIKNSNVSVDLNDASAVKAETYKFLKSNRLNIYLSSKGGDYNLCDGDVNYYDETCKITEYNNVPVIELDGHDVQQLADYVALLLTNGGGATPKTTMGVMKNNGVLTVSCVNAVVTPEGKIIKNDGTYGTGDNRTKTSIHTTDSYSLTLQNRPYDERVVVGNQTYYTITLVKYRYGIKKTDGSYYYETLYIPIYVKEKVTMRSNVRILSGEDYSYNSAKAEGKSGELVITHGSNYTIFAEFAFDSIRTKDAFKDILVEKTLIYTNSQEGIPIGTKLTMVDAQTGKEYFYTIETENVNQIPFTAFANTGTAYSERMIGDGDGGTTLTANNYTMPDGTVMNGTVGLQRYFIYVQPPEGDHNITFDFSVTAKTVDQSKNDVSGYFKSYLDTAMNMVFIPGPQISFAGVSLNTTSGIYTGTEEITYATGTISQEKTIEIDATIDISLSDSTSPYWTNKENTIDSTNNGKYIDIAISLVDDETGEEVAWPEGTNIVFNHGTPQTVTGSNLYVYKDSVKQLAFDTLDRDMDGMRRWYYYSFYDEDNQENTAKWITSDDGVNYYYYEKQTEKVALDKVTINTISMLSNHTHISLDFSLADVDDYADKKYSIVLQLYRTTDPEYPIEEEIEGDNNKYTEYKKEVTGEMNKKLGAAVSVEDTMALGINLFQNFNTEELIPFINKFDFTNVINSRNATKAEADIVECADAYYMVTYRLQKKNAEGKYETINWTDSPFDLSQVLADSSLQALTSQTIDNHQVYVEHKIFTVDEIKTGEDNVPYVTAWDLQVTADVNALKAADGTWSNYKVLVTYLPYNPTDGVPTTDASATLTDYFIFTVATLKTDM